MSEPSVFRYRITYSKADPVRYISHLDLQRTWERIFRRAALPLAFTQGYHPHPRLNLGLALPLGWTSECELMDIWLEQQIPDVDLKKILESASPPSLKIHAIQEIPINSPKLQKQIQAAVYRVQLTGSMNADILTERIGEFLKADSIERERRGKAYDIRPLVDHLVLSPEDDSILLITVSARPSATGRPDEVLLQLGLDPLQADIQRTEIVLG